MNDKKIIITGAAGFIGSCLTAFLNRSGYNNLVIADDFSRTEKQANWKSKLFEQTIDRTDLPVWMNQNASEIGFVFHLGARTDTTETDEDLFNRLNLNYTRTIWQICTEHRIPLVYASSAATYGDGAFGYTDDEQLIPKLKPLNAYGRSKQTFDLWALSQEKTPPFWAGLKFFNVFGPNEYHKGRMASVIFHSFNQIQRQGYVNLFKSHRPDYADGQQQRDFVYVMDVVNVCYWLYENRNTVQPGIYNLGSGKARSFMDLALSVFAALNIEPDIRFIDTPVNIRSAYQYYSCATMDKLREAGCDHEFYSLEDGAKAYIQHFLTTSSRF